MPLVAALSLSPEGHPLYLKLSQVNSFTKDEISAWSTKYIRSEIHVVSDGLNCFSGVPQTLCDHEPIITYNDGRYNDRKVFQWLTPFSAL